MSNDIELHGQWSQTGARRYCAHCQEWVDLVDWQHHKSDLLKMVESQEDSA